MDQLRPLPLPIRLAFPRDLLRCLQYRLAGKDFVRFAGPFSPDDSLLIDEKEVSLRNSHWPARVETPVALDHLEVRKVTQERIGELERISECLL